jgi:hypothetical protein
MALFRKLGRSVGSAGSAIALSAVLVPFSQLPAIVSENLAALGIDPDLFELPIVQGITVAMGLILTGWALWAWLAPERSGAAFDAVEQWSVSIYLGPGGMGVDRGTPGGFESFFILQGCRFANLSATQDRVLDIELKIPNKYGPPEFWTLSTTNTHRQPYREKLRNIGVEPATRFDRFLDLPIRIPPGAVVEGQIEFRVPDHPKIRAHGFWEMLDPFGTVATVIDQRSGQRRSLPSGFCYDALKGKAYRGRIGEPGRGWRARFRRLKATVRRRTANWWATRKAERA